MTERDSNWATEAAIKAIPIYSTTIQIPQDTGELLYQSSGTGPITVPQQKITPPFVVDEISWNAQPAPVVHSEMAAAAALALARSTEQESNRVLLSSDQEDICCAIIRYGNPSEEGLMQFVLKNAPYWILSRDLALSKMIRCGLLGMMIMDGRLGPAGLAAVKQRIKSLSKEDSDGTSV